jgi:diguanylate cyclase (GGDEF)-like protein/PAS domain S-box-containing protein
MTQSRNSLHLLMQYQKAFDYGTIVSKANINGTITYANNLFCNISGYSREELIGSPHNIVRHPDMPKHVFQNMWNTILNHQIWEGIIKNKRKDGSTYYLKTIISPIVNEEGEIEEFISIRHDITELMELKVLLEKENEELEHLAVTDSLTETYNRFKFDDMLEKEVKRSMRYHRPFSLLYFDIDHFKNINDKYGHSFGDDVLKKIAYLVKENIREADTLFRIGGEEFTILSVETNQKNVFMLAEKIRSLVERKSFNVEEQITISIGIVQYKIGDSSAEILNKVDKAMYAAKQNGRNRVEVYE